MHRGQEEGEGVRVRDRSIEAEEGEKEEPSVSLEKLMCPYPDKHASGSFASFPPTSRTHPRFVLPCNRI